MLGGRSSAQAGLPLLSVNPSRTVSSPVSTARENVRRDRVESELGATEHVEAGVVDGPPRQVDEPPTGSSLDERAGHVEAVSGLRRLAVELPPCGRRVARCETLEFVGTVASLHCDMHVVVTVRPLGARAARPAGRSRRRSRSAPDRSHGAVAWAVLGRRSAGSIG